MKPSVCRFLISASTITLFLTAGTASAQLTSITPDVAPPVPGAGHDYIHFLNESVSPANGSVSIRIKVPMPTDRALALPFAFGYDSNAAHHFTPPVGSFAWNASASSLSQGGWTYELPNETFSASISWQSPQPIQAGVDGAICPYYSAFTVTDRNGTSHETGISVPTNLATCSPSGEGPTIQLGGGDSSLYATTTIPGNAYQQTPPSPLTVTDSDGTVYYFANTSQSLSEITTSGDGSPQTCCYLPGSDISLPTYIEDRNGNQLTFTNNGANGISVTDDMGRTVLTTSGFGATGNTVAVSGLSSPYTVTWANEPYSFQMQTETIAPQAILFPDPAWSCGTGQSSTYTQTVSLSGSQPEISSLTLPNGQSYSFQYDPVYGQISKIIYPTGAYVRYVWGLTSEYTATKLFPPYNAGGIDGPTPSNLVMSELSCETLSHSVVVLQRFVSFDGHTEALEQDFNYSTALIQAQGAGDSPSDQFQRWSTATTSVVTKDLIRDTSYTTTYDYKSSGPLPQTYVAGLPQYYTGVFDAMPLETEITTTDFSGNPLSIVNESYTSPYVPPSDKQTSLNGTSVSDIQTVYSTIDNMFLLPTDTCTYNGTGSSTLCGNSNSLLQHTHTDYASLPTTPAGGTIADRPSDVIVYNGSGARVGETDFAFDGASLNPVTAAAHDEGNFSASYIHRGNVTTVTRQCFASTGSCPSPISTYVYDQTGQVYRATDADLNTTTYIYTDDFTDNTPSTNTNGYLTQVIHPTVNGVPHIENYAYRYSDGQLSWAKDENNQQTSYNYNDPWGRLTNTAYPDGGNVAITYNDAGPDPTVTQATLLNAATGVTKTTETIGDGAWHPITTLDTSDPDGTIEVDTSYDGNGRVYTVSNPYRGNNPSYAITTTVYDSLGRLTQRINPDQQQSSVTYQFNGNAVTYTDEVGNQWTRTSDALGRLIQVFEPSGTSQSPTLPTNYVYDALGNLLSVNQVGSGSNLDGPPRNRSFAYNSLGRLIAAYNPEKTNANGPTQTCIGASGLWSNCYSYDPDGNLIAETDNRGITTNRLYDSLNRVYATSYSQGGVSTTDPLICTQYDVAASTTPDPYPIGRMTMEWTVPSTNQCPALNQPVTALPSAALNATLFEHEKMGRTASESQCPTSASCAAPYVFNYTYDQAGSTLSSNNGLSASGAAPDPVAFSFTYDSDERLNTVGVTTQPSSWSTTNYLNDPELLQVNPTAGYDPFGHLVNAVIGVTSSNPGGVADISRTYDSRGRLLNDVGSGSPTASSGSIIIIGSEASVTSPATSGSGVLTVTGKYSGSGAVSVTIDNFTSTASCSSLTTFATIAGALARGFSAAGSPVTAVASGALVKITAIATGAASNYSITISNGCGYTVSDGNDQLTGGTNGGNTVYDAGTATATITNNSVLPWVRYTTSPVSWGQGSTSSTLANSLAAAINSIRGGSPVTATANGSTVDLVSTTTGPNTNYSVSVSVVDTQTSMYPSLFPSPSFQASASNMAGGTAAGAIYTYNATSYAPNGNLLSHSDSVTGSWNFGYDTLNRLTSAQNTGTTSTSSQYAGYYGCWGYDSFGNRLPEVWQTSTCPSPNPEASPDYNVNNQVTSFSQSAPSSVSAPSGFQYDAAGDVTYDGANYYAYDGDGRLCAVETSSTGGPSYTAYEYNADGTRVAKGSTSSLSCNENINSQTGLPYNGFTLTGQYLLDLKGNQVTELNGSGTWTHTNVFAGELLATYDGSGIHFPFTDPLGTKRVQINSAGAVDETCFSLPYGNALFCNGDDATEHHFTGKERDTESGNDYFGARYYESSMGRWLSPDWSAKVAPVPYAKMDDPQSLNLYSYVVNNPLGTVDPDGHGGNCPDNFGSSTCPIGNEVLNGQVDNAAQQQSGDPTLPTEVQPPPPSLADKIETALMPKTPLDAALLVVPGDLGEVGEAGEALSNAAKIEKLTGEAKELYPKLAEKADQLHHVIPRYLGGAQDGELAKIPAAYHQLITNAFRTLAPYGKAVSRTAEEVTNIVKQVYSMYPLH